MMGARHALMKRWLITFCLGVARSANPEELKERATLGFDLDSIVCDLSSSGLTLDATFQLAELTRKMLDAVEYLDLSLNYFPPLHSLKDDKDAETDLKDRLRRQQLLWGP
ncbi:hypothetical protein WJX82_011375 [Trebouxia sp. C0006]